MRRFNYILIVVIMLLFFGLLIFAIAVSVDYSNKGKKALINNNDTCIIISQESKYRIPIGGKMIRVLYKDKEGRYTEQYFHEEMITIIN